VQITAVRVAQSDPTIAVSNSSSGQAHSSAWILLLGPCAAVLPASPNLRIQPGATVTPHLSSGTDSATDGYLEAAPPSLRYVDRADQPVRPGR
jgi:hypothetical protein